MGKLDGRVAVVTAGTRSIGRGIAEAYLAEGAKVVTSGRSAEKGATALKEIIGRIPPGLPWVLWTLGLTSSRRWPPGRRQRRRRGP